MATLYCGPSDTGNGSGSNFNNLMELPDGTGFTRGNIYIIVDGTYGDRSLQTALSGSTTITIKKASSADSGVTGYVSTLHDGQATFSNFFVYTGYWIINGVTRTESNVYAAPAGYGIRAAAFYINGFSGMDGSNSQFSYIDVGETWNENPSAAVILTYGSPFYLTVQSNITISRCAIHNGGHDGALAMIHASDNIIFEYCFIAHGWGKATIASPNAGSQNCTFRYNRFHNSAQKDPNDPTGGLTCEIGSYSVDFDLVGHLIYGNLFSSNVNNPGRNAVIMYGEPARSGNAVNCKVFNNTFAGVLDDSVINGIYLKDGSGNEVRNNLIYDCGNLGITANSSSNNVYATVDPFVDYANFDLRLTSSNEAIDAGTNLGASYNQDPLGTTRGSGGAWDVGAYEFDSGSAAPDAPTNFRLI